jgi:putative DNA primase/helicase
VSEIEALIAGDPGPQGKAPAPKFNAPALAAELCSETSIAAGGEALYVFDKGAYRPGGEGNLKRRIAVKLGSDWKKRHQDEVLAYLHAIVPRLWEAPPLDRVNCANGILDIGTGKLEPHDPDFLSPVQIAAAFDPAKKCPRIERFLREILDPELAPVIHELAGYLTVPDQSLQVAVMALGGGENGKSTLLSTLVRFLGKANVSAVPLHRLDEDRFASAQLYGRLANIVADLDSRALKSSSVFKGITGGDLLPAERKFRPAFNFYPYARLIYSANEVPPTPDSSEAFFRRWLILPFERSFKGKADRRLLGKLTTPAELSGLLNLAIAALPALRERGRFAETETSRQAAERFRVDADSVAGFIAEHVVVELDARIAKSELFSSYRSWCQENNRQPFSAQRFNRQLAADIPSEQLTESRPGGTRQWIGIRMRGMLG